MLTKRYWRSGVAWVMCIAIMLMSLVPLISHAVQTGNRADAPVHEICTAQGSVGDTARPQGNSEMPDQHAGHADDCPYCRLTSDVPALPAAGINTLPVRCWQFTNLSDFYRSPDPLSAWVFANPRDPPRSS